MSRALPSLPHEPRPRCDRCRKPAALCLCARTRSVANRTQVLVVQHRRERSHAVGTARIVRLGLEASQIVETSGVLARPALLPGAALLYPGPGSRELSALSAQQRPRQLVVLDGTWHHARRLFLDNAWLRELPRVRLTAPSPSRYRIRKQPAAHCVSTLESIVEALRVLEPETRGLDGLLEVFDAMVAEQQAFMSGPGARPRERHRLPRPSRALPAGLRELPGRVLFVYAETAPGQAEARGGRRQLVRWSALRARDGALFDRVVRPEGAVPAAGHLAHMGLEPAALVGAARLGELARDWRAFRRDDELLVSWHPGVLRVLDWLEDRTPERLALRTSWSNVLHERPQGLERLVQQLGLEVPRPELPGRAAERLGQALAIARHLVALAPREVHR